MKDLDKEIVSYIERAKVICRETKLKVNDKNIMDVVSVIHMRELQAKALRQYHGVDINKN